MVPQDLRYTKEHEWVRVEGDLATVGITDYAAEQLGDIVFVELPELGRTVDPVRARRRDRVGQGRQRLFAPVGGEVVEANAELRHRRSCSTAIRSARAGCCGSGSPTPARSTACSTRPPTRR